MSPAVRIHVVSRSTVVAPADVAEYYTPMLRKQVGDSLALLVPELVRDLIARSATKVTLDSSRLVTRMPVVMLGPVVSPPTSDPRENWANFAKQYPGALGYVTLTRPGYDASRTACPARLRPSVRAALRNVGLLRGRASGQEVEAASDGGSYRVVARCRSGGASFVAPVEPLQETNHGHRHRPQPSQARPARRRSAGARACSRRQIVAGVIFVTAGTMKVFGWPASPVPMPAFDPTTWASADCSRSLADCSSSSVCSRGP